MMDKPISITSYTLTNYTPRSQPRPKDVLQPCCCCLCACSNKKTDGETCYGCFPIKCGISTIGGFVIILTLCVVSYNFFLLLNDYWDWYYPFIVLAIYIPLIFACAFFISWNIRDSTSTRTKLNWACMLIIGVFVAKTFWTFYYIYYYYKYDVVYLGYNDPQEHTYVHFTKKYYVFMECLYALIIIALFAYFTCVCAKYKELMEPTEAERKAQKEIEKKSK